MSTDFAQPVLSTAYATLLTNLKDRDVSAITLCKDDPSNIPTDAIKYDRATNKFRYWNGSAWVDLVLDLAGGGTAATSASGARTSLGLGTIAVQDNNAVNLTGGTIAGPTLRAGDISSGTVPVARLGSGSTGAGQRALFDDSTWKIVDGPIGSGSLWFWSADPTDTRFLICDGRAVSRATYATLFALIGTTYGVGDGATTFNIPDFRGRFPFGKAAAGTGNTLGGTFGSIDHTHTGPSHTHSVPGLSVPGLTLPAAVSITSGFESVNHIHGGVTAGGDLTGGASVGHTHNVTALDGTGITGTGTTGTGTSGAAGTGATGTNNPPGLAINFIIKVL